MTYDALELSEKIIDISNKEKMNITQLQLQKVLYYVQGGFMKEFGEKAFSDPIENWPYGPVVRNVWRAFSAFGRSPITDISSNLIINKREHKLIKDILNEKLVMNPWKLVDETHEELPWRNANLKNTEYLSDEDMWEFFVKR